MTSNDLKQGLALASHELRAQLPPATLLPAIHRQLVRGQWKPRSAGRRWLGWAGWAGLSTASVALAAAFVLHSTITDAPEVTASEDGFVALVNNAGADGNEGTWIVSTELPHSRLAALGLPYDPSRAGERVPAQLLMHSSGEVLAVRLSR